MHTEKYHYSMDVWWKTVKTDEVDFGEGHNFILRSQNLENFGSKKRSLLYPTLKAAKQKYWRYIVKRIGMVEDPRDKTVRYNSSRQIKIITLEHYKYGINDKTKKAHTFYKNLIKFQVLFIPTWRLFKGWYRFFFCFTKDKKGLCISNVPLHNPESPN